MDAGHNRRNKAAFLNFFGEAWKLGQITRPKRSRGAPEMYMWNTANNATPR